MTAEHNARAGKIGALVRQHQSLSAPSYFAGELVPEQQFDGVGARRQFHILPVEDVVARNRLVLFRRKVDAKAASQARDDFVLCRPDHPDDFELDVALVSFLIELYGVWRNFDCQRHDVSPFLESERIELEEEGYARAC